MAGEVDLHLNIANGLEKSVDNAKNSMKQFNDVSQKTNKIAEKINQGFQAIGNSIKAALAPVAALFSVGMVFEFTKSVLEADQAMRNLSYQMGEGGQSAQFLTQSVYDVTTEVGIAIDQSQSLIKTLKEFRVANEDIKQLAIDTARFSKITGASSETAGILAGKLMRVGRLGQEATSDILAGMVKTQRAVGLTTSEVESLSDTIVFTTQHLTQLGKSSAFIEDFTKRTTQLAGAFAEVGVEAQEATKLIERLLDPGQIEDNALLYSKLGISIQDAISGNIDPQQVQAGLKGLGSELKNMNQIAASELAKSMGMSLHQLRQMSEMPLGDVTEALGGTANASEELAKYQDEQMGPMEKLRQAWNGIQGTLATIVNQFMPIIQEVLGIITDHTDSIIGGINNLVKSGGLQKIIENVAGFIGKLRTGINTVINVIKNTLSNPKFLIAGLLAVIGVFALLRRKFRSVATDSRQATANALEEGVSSGMSMGAEKGFKIMQRKAAAASEEVAKQSWKTMRESGEEEFENIQAQYLKAIGQMDMSAGGQKRLATAAKWVEWTSKGAKTAREHVDYQTDLNKRIMESARLSNSQYREQQQILQTGVDTTRETIDQYNARLTELKTMEQTSAVIYEQRKLQKELNKLNEQELQGTKEIEKLESQRRKREQQYLKRMSTEELTRQKNEIANQEMVLIKEVQQRQESQKMLEIERSMAREQEQQLKQTIASLDTEAKRKAYAEQTGVEYTELIKKHREANKLANELNKEYDQGEQEINSMGKELDELNKKQTGIISAMQGRADADVNKIFDRPVDRLLNVFRKGAHTVGTNLQDKVNKMSNSFKAFGKHALTVANPRNLINALRRYGGGSAIAGAFKGVSKGLFGVFKRGAGLFSKKFRSAATDAAETQNRKGPLRRIGGMFGKIAMIGGPIMMIARLLGKMEPVQEMMANLMEKLKVAIEPIVKLLTEMVGKIMAILMPIIEDLIEILMPIVNDLLDAVMPILLTALQTLAPILTAVGGVIGDLLAPILDLLSPLIEKLIKFLMPPLLIILGFAIKVIEKLVGIIGKLIEYLVTLPQRIGVAIDAATPGGELNRRSSPEEVEAELQRRITEKRKSSKFVDAALNLSEGLKDASENIGKQADATIEMGKQAWKDRNKKIDISGISYEDFLGEPEGEKYEGSSGRGDYSAPETTTDKGQPVILKATSTGITLDEKTKKLKEDKQLKAAEEQNQTMKKIEEILRNSYEGETLTNKKLEELIVAIESGTFKGSGRVE